MTTRREFLRQALGLAAIAAIAPAALAEAAPAPEPAWIGGHPFQHVHEGRTIVQADYAAAEFRAMPAGPAWGDTVVIDGTTYEFVADGYDLDADTGHIGVPIEGDSMENLAAAINRNDKQAVIAEYIKTPENRIKLAESMAQPTRTRLEYPDHVRGMTRDLVMYDDWQDIPTEGFTITDAQHRPVATLTARQKMDLIDAYVQTPKGREHLRRGLSESVRRAAAKLLG